MAGVTDHERRAHVGQRLLPPHQDMTPHEDTIKGKP